MAEKNSTKHYLVYTPEYSVIIPILNYGEGPSETTCDIVCLDAVNKKDAKIKGVKLIKQKYPNGWFSNNEGNPFTGIKVEIAECEHGLKTCGEDEECLECASEIKKQLYEQAIKNS